MRQPSPRAIRAAYPTYEGWHAAVDRYCLHHYFLSIDGLPDYSPLHQWYTQSMPPSTAARRAYAAARKG